VDMNQTIFFCVLKLHTMMNSFQGYKERAARDWICCRWILPIHFSIHLNQVKLLRRRRQQVPLKRWNKPILIHGVKPQRTVINAKLSICILQAMTVCSGSGYETAHILNPFHITHNVSCVDRSSVELFGV